MPCALSGVNARWFAPGVEPRLAGRRRILCISRLDDFGPLLEAYVQLPDAFPATSRLLLAGPVGPTPGWQRVGKIG
jgi:hypothetical protein